MTSRATRTTTLQAKAATAGTQEGGRADPRRSRGLLRSPLGMCATFPGTRRSIQGRRSGENPMTIKQPRYLIPAVLLSACYLVSTAGMAHGVAGPDGFSPRLRDYEFRSMPLDKIIASIVESECLEVVYDPSVEGVRHARVDFT